MYSLPCLVWAGGVYGEKYNTDFIKEVVSCVWVTGVVQDKNSLILTSPV